MNGSSYRSKVINHRYIYVRNKNNRNMKNIEKRSMIAVLLTVIVSVILIISLVMYKESFDEPTFKTLMAMLVTMNVSPVIIMFILMIDNEL